MLDPSHSPDVPGTPRVVDMPQAPEVIRALAAHVTHVAAAHTDTRPIVIGITGPVGAGKSTLAALLSPCIISTDHYLPDYDLTPEHLRDLPEHSDLPRLAADLASLRRGHQTSIPIWSFQTHKRMGEQPLAPPPAAPHNLVVVEGLHALHDTHAHALDLRVYVDAPSALRWARWEHLEATGQRGWGVEVARTFFNNVAEPTFNARSAEYRGSAHVVVINDRYAPPST